MAIVGCFHLHRRSWSMRWRRHLAARRTECVGVEESSFTHTTCVYRWACYAFCRFSAGCSRFWRPCAASYLLYLGLPRLMKSPAGQVHSRGTIVVVDLHHRAMPWSRVASGIMIGGAAHRRRAAQRRVRLALQQRRATCSSTRTVRSASCRISRLQARREQQEDGSGAEERRHERAGGRGDQIARDAARWRETRVDPISIDELKPFVPETFAGLLEKEQQRCEERHGRHHGVESRSHLRRRRR